MTSATLVESCSCQTDTCTERAGSGSKDLNPYATNVFADGLSTITRLGLYGDDPRSKP